MVCSSFKFPPTALDEEAIEEFRTRESQVCGSVATALYYFFVYTLQCL